MKLLLVDDEELTREGILTSIEWKELGVHRVLEADDGVHGLSLALMHKPEIILSDVKMPRMTGIEMAVKIRESQPDCSIIFMSGYSDKEYLKAAIKLKAVNYVEKPILIPEIKTAVAEAVQTQQKHLQTLKINHYQYNHARSRLALKLTAPSAFTNRKDYLLKFKELSLPILPNTRFSTLIIQFHDPISDLPDSELSHILKELKSCILEYRSDCLFTLKQDKYLIIHLISKIHINTHHVERIGKEILNIIPENYNIYISAGNIVSGPENVYESYSNAVILMQSAFFYPYNSMVLQIQKTDFVMPEKLEEQFMEALNQRDKSEASLLINRFYSSLRFNQVLLPSQIIERYYSLYNTLKAACTSCRILQEDKENNVLDYISSNKNLDEIHTFILGQTDIFFQKLQESHSDNATIYAIKEYISKNYQNCFLSIKDISEHIYLSSSYLCTIFKTETGTTLNQYLTSYRMEKAKRLLADKRYKITDISAQIGYRDGNYFGKSFKKYVGISPSEYREMNLNDTAG